MSSTLKFAAGFRAAGVRCGMKKDKLDKALDMAMIASSTPCTAAAVFTKNKFKAAPVLFSKSVLDTNSDDIYGVLINSGCANACTGDEGYKNATEMAMTATQLLRPGATKPHALVMSTGVIGQHLDMNKIKRGAALAHAELSAKSVEEGWHSAARAIMTTDTVPKLVASQFDLKGGNVSVTGIAKGAGMIHPNMATMLGILVTDAKVAAAPLADALRYAVDRSFNCISIDGDTSTNDSVYLLANGQAKGVEINDTTSDAYITFRDGLTRIAKDLAVKLVRDGEGATKFASVLVQNAATFADARTVASSVATSNLVKTALYGEDANWGRILCAVGYSGVEINTQRVNMWISASKDGKLATQELQLVKNGAPFDVNEEIASHILKHVDINIRIDLGAGSESVTYYTCDFSLDYVKINANYRT